jgi:hypothetical protein
MEGDKWGVIDTVGRETIKPKYDIINNFSNGLTLVKQENKWWLIDTTGREITEVGEYCEIVWMNGMARINIGNKFGLVNTDSLILPCEYSGIFPSGYQEFMLEQNGAYGYFAPQKGVILPCNFEEIGYFGEENDWIRVKRNGKWGWVDITGKVMIPCRYDIVAPFVNGKARVIQKPYESPFFINTKGEFLLESLVEE